MIIKFGYSNTRSRSARGNVSIDNSTYRLPNNNDSVKKKSKENLYCNIKKTMA